jgi:hypothetical protein
MLQTALGEKYVDVPFQNVGTREDVMLSSYVGKVRDHSKQAASPPSPRNCVPEPRALVCRLSTPSSSQEQASD